MFSQYKVPNCQLDTQLKPWQFPHTCSPSTITPRIHTHKAAYTQTRPQVHTNKWSIQVYTNEYINHSLISGHGSWAYAYRQNLTNAEVKTTPAGFPPSLSQLPFHHSPPLSPDNSCTTLTAHYSLPNAVGCVNTAHSHIHRARTVRFVCVSSPGLAARALCFS